MVQFQCNGAKVTGPLPHFWEHTIGSGHATLALRADWQEQLRRCHRELGVRHVRFHGLLNDDMGTLVCKKQKLIYSFFNTDRIWDFLLSIGMRPFVELSFMPEALASGATTIFHYRGNVTPPKDYKQWATLIGKMVAHWTRQFGPEEVRQWFFEVWNEPNLKEFWTGGQNAYFELYRYTAEAIKAVDDRYVVGGPATAKEEWIEEFLGFCDKHSLPADFISTHHYPNDVLWQEDQDTETQLANSRRGILREWTQEARRRAGDRPLYYTEWACSSNPRYQSHDEPYAAAFVVKTIMEARGLVDGYSFWTFSDIFEESYFPSVPFHGGFGLLNIHGIPKPAYRAFEMLHRLGNECLLVEGTHETVDAWAIKAPNGITILLTNHALPRQPIQTQGVRIVLTGTPAPGSAIVERIDRDHANPKLVWREMGEPEYLRMEEVEHLQEASQLVHEPQCWSVQNGVIHFEMELPPHAVAALTVEFPNRE
ncbi:MAG TPA: glycosyl hydrolase [Gemmataceae bacterium]|nr:glycosyl hydrolase [Gemmataceae bacterium]